MRTELVTTLKRRATVIIAQLTKHGQPVLITEHGRAAAYLVSAKSFESLQNRMRILEGIARGEKAVREKRVLSHNQAKKRMKRWLA